MRAEGAKVIATDINAAALEGLDCETRVLNVRDKAAVQALAEEVGPLDVLFNCAGFVAAGTILDCDEEQWAFSVDLNMTAMYRMCKAFLPGMIAGGGGSIINMASVAGSVLAAPKSSWSKACAAWNTGGTIAREPRRWSLTATF